MTNFSCVRMESSNSLDLENLSLLLAHDNKLKNLELEPTPYTFTRVENGKKLVIDSPNLTPPSWLLLDHTIAVIWLMFSQNIPAHQLNINDLKWAHEFLKGIRNSKGEIPMDVKTCLKEIQDRLIHLYARLTNLKDDFHRESISEESKKINSRQLDRRFYASSLSPSRTTVKTEYPLLHGHSSRDLSVTMPKQKKTATNHSKKTFPLNAKNSNIFEDTENLCEDEEIQNCILSLFEDDKKEETLHALPSAKSFIPTKKKLTPSMSFSEVTSSREFSGTIKESPNPKRVHCVAEMRSVKYQKSMKVQDNNGEEAAYSNLKAEIQRLTFNPNVSKDELKTFLKEWRVEQVEKLRNELNRLNSIEEIIKGVEEVQPDQDFLLSKNELESNNSYIKSLISSGEN